MNISITKNKERRYGNPACKVKTRFVNYFDRTWNRIVTLYEILSKFFFILLAASKLKSAVGSEGKHFVAMSILIPNSTADRSQASLYATVEAAVKAASCSISGVDVHITPVVLQSLGLSAVDLLDLSYIFGQEDPASSRYFLNINNNSVVQNYDAENNCNSNGHILDFRGDGGYRLLQNSSQVIVGPSNALFCDLVAALSNNYDIPLVSYLCTQSIFRNKLTTNTVISVVPNDQVTVTAVAAYMRYFQWRSVVAITAADIQMYSDLDGTVDYVLDMNGPFFVSNHFQVTADITFDNASDVLKKIDKSIKVILLILPHDSARVVMLAAQSLGMTLGDYCFILIDSFDPLFMNQNMTMANPLASTNQAEPTNGTEVSSDKYLESLFILKAHCYSIIIHNQQDPSMHEKNFYDDRLYNAIILAYSMIEAGISNNLNLTDGKSLIKAAYNLSVPAIRGNVTTGPTGDLPFHFTLWDYSSAIGEFIPVLEVKGETNVVVKSSENKIVWPGGRQPSQDTCYFSDACTVRTKLIATLTSVLFVLLCTVASIIACILRRRYVLKSLKNGPQKIILSFEELVFVAPKHEFVSKMSLSAKTLRERPINNRRSSEMRSFTSLQTVHGERKTNIARYNGDLMFMKELFIKNFVVNGSVRHYLKSVGILLPLSTSDVYTFREHENVNPFVGCFSDPVRPSLVYEYCPRRSLEDVLLNEDIKLDWEFKLSFLTDLVHGMRYIHNSVLKHHGALKSRNCVVDSRWVLKVTDFGILGIFEKFNTLPSYTASEQLWTAPELLRGECALTKASQKGDVYSFSIIMQEVILRGAPFFMLNRSADEIIQKIIKPPPLCRPSVSPGAAPPEYIQIMKQCWGELPDTRPDFDDISHRFKSLNKGKKVNIVDTMFKMLEKYSTDLEEVVRIRTVALEEERKKTENLLAQMLPASVAHALLTGCTVDPEWYDDVTIYFSDIVGFTTISAISTPMQVVQLLNDLYTTFDSTIDDYDVYKVETIGDAYMVCSGLPVRNQDHAGQIGTLSLDILSKCGQFTIQHLPDLPLRIRIGLHSGSCVAGVVGLRMPRYCLFGDTVNTASRMESTGSAFRIHVSKITRDELVRLNGGYQIQLRGEVELKGKGMHQTFWLVGKQGFNKPLPEPPPQNGENNHGLDINLVENLLKDESKSSDKKKNVEESKQAKPDTKPLKNGSVPNKDIIQAIDDH